MKPTFGTSAATGVLIGDLHLAHRTGMAGLHGPDPCPHSLETAIVPQCGHSCATWVPGRSTLSSCLELSGRNTCCGPGPASADRFMAARAAPSSRVSFSDFILIVSIGCLLWIAGSSRSWRASRSARHRATHPPGKDSAFFRIRDAAWQPRVAAAACALCGPRSQLLRTPCAVAAGAPTPRRRTPPATIRGGDL